jgi:hypothetical protein
MIEVDFRNFDISKFIDKAKGRTRAFALEFVQDLNVAVVRATPVLTGFLRGSWYASLNSEAAGQGALDASGGQSVARMNLTAAQMKLGDVFHAQNGASYAVFVEFGTQHMAPRAFVRGTLDRANLIAEGAARKVAAR